MRAMFLPLLAVCALAGAPAGLADDAAPKVRYSNQIHLKITQVSVRPDAWSDVRGLFTPQGPQIRTVDRQNWRAEFAARVAQGKVRVLDDTQVQTLDGQPHYFELNEAGAAAASEKYRILVIPTRRDDHLSLQLSVFRGKAAASDSFGKALIGSTEVAQGGTFTIRLSDDPAEPLLLLTATMLPLAR